MTKDAEGTVIETRTCTYDAKDNILTETYTDKDNKEIKSTVYTYDAKSRQTGYVTTYADGDKETNTREYYSNGEWSLNKTVYEYSDGSSHTDEDTYYTNGNRKSETYTSLDANGKVSSKSEYTYYENGSNKSTTSSYSDGRRDEYAYNEDGNEVSYYSYAADGTTVTYKRESTYAGEFCEETVTTYSDGSQDIETYTYHENGELATDTTIYADGRKEEYTYTEDGKDLSSTNTNANGNVTYKEEYTYLNGKKASLIRTWNDSEGNFVDSESYTYDENEKVVSAIDKYSDGSTEEYTYVNGNLVKQENKDAEGNLTYSETDFEYDDNGNRIKYTYTYYYDSSEPSSTTVSREYYASNNYIKYRKYEYSSKNYSETWYDEKSYGRELEYKYTQGDGVVTSHYTYKYDDDGNRIETKYYDNEGNVSQTISYEYNADGYKTKVSNVTPNYLWETIYDGTSDYKVVHENEQGEFVEVLIQKQQGYSTFVEDFDEDDAVATGGAIKFVRLETDYNEDDNVTESKVYTVLESGEKVLNITATYQYHDNGISSRTVWEYADNSKRIWCFDSNGTKIYYAEFDKNGVVNQETLDGTDPDAQ